MREKNTLTFLIGPCLSGKSHYCEKMKSEDCVIVSSDAKRLELGITTYDPSTHGLVFAECKKRYLQSTRKWKRCYIRCNKSQQKTKTKRYPLLQKPVS